MQQRDDDDLLRIIRAAMHEHHPPVAHPREIPRVEIFDHCLEKIAIILFVLILYSLLARLVFVSTDQLLQSVSRR
jgi:hypothetical protein